MRANYIEIEETEEYRREAKPQEVLALAWGLDRVFAVRIWYHIVHRRGGKGTGRIGQQETLVWEYLSSLGSAESVIPDFNQWLPVLSCAITFSKLLQDTFEFSNLCLRQLGVLR
jgi:hypothetical protein